MKAFNINEFIYIQITPAGWKLLRKSKSDFAISGIEGTETIIDGVKWYKIQCWKVFELFPVRPGTPTYFKMTILIDNKSLINP